MTATRRWIRDPVGPRRASISKVVAIADGERRDWKTSEKTGSLGHKGDRGRKKKSVGSGEKEEIIRKEMNTTMMSGSKRRVQMRRCG